MSAGLFRPDDDGAVRAPVDLGFKAGDVVAVTVEPEGGSDTPTLPMVLSVEL